MDLNKLRMKQSGLCNNECIQELKKFNSLIREATKQEGIIPLPKERRKKKYHWCPKGCGKKVFYIHPNKWKCTECKSMFDSL